MTTKNDILRNLKERPQTLPVIPEGIPDELKALEQWVCWAWRSRDGKWTKVPVDAKTGGNASTTDPAYWSTFDQVLAYYQQPDNCMAGVGFVFTADDPYCGVDFDDTTDTPPVIAMRSYSERSPSGTGFHSVVKAKLADGARNRKGKLEVYDSGRYFATTGHRVTNTPSTVEERQAEVDALLPSEPVVATVAGPTGGCTLSDAELLRLARNAKDGAKFTRLYDTMEWSPHYSSESEADLALCSLLAFWTGPDPERIDQLFRSSKRCREKWLKRADYRDQTIRAALKGKTDFYTPGAQLMQSDGGNAERLRQQFGDDLRFIPQWHTWAVWGPQGWRIEAIDQITPRMRSVVKSMYATAAARLAGLAEVQDEEEKKARRKQVDRAIRWAIDSDSNYRIKAAIEQASRLPGMQTPADEWNRDPMSLKCVNGVIDLRTGTLRDHHRGDCALQLCPTPYHPNTVCPEWQRFLNEIFARDADLIRFMQRLCGYCITGDVSEHKLPIFYGEGANGKSTLLRAIMDTLGGDYAMKAPSGLLMYKRNESHPTEVASLFGKRLAVCVETEEGQRIAESRVKDLTGGDIISARRMREDFWDFSPTHKIVLCTNHKPRVNATDLGFWRRVWVVPFSVTIEEVRQDKHLGEKLKAEAPGILTWCVQGCLAWQREGMKPPSTVTQATASYRSEEDRVEAFFAEQCQMQGTENASALYRAYCDWTTRRGERPMNQTRFGQALNRAGYEKHQSDGRVVYRGISLRFQRAVAA